jgi:hypothetical protein
MERRSDWKGPLWECEVLGRERDVREVTENRSAAMFVEMLRTALEEEYGVPTKREAVDPPDRDTVEEVHGVAAAVKAEAGVL